jgi:hypothetical protein
MTLKRWSIAEFDYTALTSWTASSSGTNEYYYSGTLPAEWTNDAEVDVGPSFVKVDGLVAAEGTVGSLTAGQYAYDDNDTLGNNTVYVRLASGSSPGSTDVYYFVEDTQTLMTAGAAVETILLSLLISNYSTTSDANIVVEHTDGSNNIFEWEIDLLYTDSPFALDSKIVLEPSDVIQVTSNNPDVSVLASGDES